MCYTRCPYRCSADCSRKEEHTCPVADTPQKRWEIRTSLITPRRQAPVGVRSDARPAAQVQVMAVGS